MRVEEVEALVLLLQRLDELQQGDVLVDIGEIAGVEDVAVLHVIRTPSACLLLHFGDHHMMRQARRTCG